MKQRLNLVTLGVADLGRSRRFYEALGWTTGAGPEDDVVFFQAGDMVVALWDRARLAETFWGGYTSVILDPDGHPWEIAHNPHWTIAEDGGVRLGGGD